MQSAGLGLRAGRQHCPCVVAPTVAGSVAPTVAGSVAPTVAGSVAPTVAGSVAPTVAGHSPLNPDTPAELGLSRVGQPGDLPTKAVGTEPPPHDSAEGSNMDHDTAGTQGQAGPSRPDPGKAVLAFNAVVAAVGGTYASTHSLAVTVVAGCAGLVCAVLVTWKKK
jgi:hypothetical protein